jgi:hypothetical protein
MAAESWYKFTVRTPDGHETPPASGGWPAVRLGDALYNPRWSGDSFGHGDAATMTVDAPGLDGRAVRFTVEHFREGEWSRQTERTAVVADGKASAEVEVQHPVAGDPAASATDLRFHCELLKE